MRSQKSAENHSFLFNYVNFAKVFYQINDELLIKTKIYFVL